jgi:acetyl-CoA carboxylase biotin carboxylase subunit
MGAVLVANRGEIACRVIRACRELGVRSVAVYSDVDVDSLHVRCADAAVRIGPPRATESYLRMDAIIAAAVESGAAAVHPGYGFLAENADFAERCAEAGLTFIGPRAETIRRMGDKAAARSSAIAAHVPVVPGTETLARGDAAAAAEEIGFPVMIKAAGGGGGRGIRIVNSSDELRVAFPEAEREAQAAFGDKRLYLEKVIENARHVEVQVVGDGEGGVIHLFDRECSIQRKRQKLIEEAPAPTIAAPLRAQITEAAVRLAHSVQYLNAGTVEFLVTENGAFYFMEMNTRIQVEHPVTEMVTGVDVVAQQLAIAYGDGLSISQPEISLTGAAIECRINAEDTERDFMPSPGPVQRLVVPRAPGVRLDFGVEQGGQIQPFYDSLVGKLIVGGETRDQAVERTAAALDELAIDGIQTTIPLHRRIVAEPWFARAEFDTTTLERRLAAEQGDDARHAESKTVVVRV